MAIQVQEKSKTKKDVVKLSPVRPKKIPLWHQYYRSYKYNVYAFFAVAWIWIWATVDSSDACEHMM